MRRLCFAVLAVFAVCGRSAAVAPLVSTAYVPYHFTPDEGWKVVGGGDIARSRLDHGKLLLDFSRGASWIGIAPADRAVFFAERTQFGVRRQVCRLSTVH